MQVAVIFSNSGQPSHAEVCSVLESMQQRFAAVCALLHGRVEHAAGPSLRSVTAAASRGLLQACQAFLDSLSTPVRPLLLSVLSLLVMIGKPAIDMLQIPYILAGFNVHHLFCGMCCPLLQTDVHTNALQGDTEQLPRKVGIIRECCTAIARAPRDNRAAIGIQLTKVLQSSAQVPS